MVRWRPHRGVMAARERQTGGGSGVYVDLIRELTAGLRRLGATVEPQELGRAVWRLPELVFCAEERKPAW